MSLTLRHLMLVIAFSLFMTSCVPATESDNTRIRVIPEVVQRPVLPVLYESLDLPYTIRQSEQPTGLPDLVMLNNSIRINSISTLPLEESIDVTGLLVDAGIFGGKFLLRLTAHLNVEDPQDSFAMHQYDSLILDVDGQKISLSRDTNDIGVAPYSAGGFIEYGFYTAFPNLYLIMAQGKHVSLELIGGKDGIDRRLVASFTEKNRQRFEEFHVLFDEVYR